MPPREFHLPPLKQQSGYGPVYTRANWHFDGKWVKYIELYIQMPANSTFDHIRKIILVKSCKDRFTFVLHEKFTSCFIPVGSSCLTQMSKKKRYWKSALNTFGTIEWDVKSRKKNLLTFFKVFRKSLCYVSFANLFFLIP